MSGRLATGLFVAALIRRVQAEGGNTMVLARGDDSAGGLIVLCSDRGEMVKIIERGQDFENRLVWRPITADLARTGTLFADYLAKRRRIDPDLWAIELDSPDSERFAAEMIATN